MSKSSKEEVKNLELQHRKLVPKQELRNFEQEIRKILISLLGTNTILRDLQHPSEGFNSKIEKVITNILNELGI